MKLADLRKVSIQRQYRIHFRLGNGMECVVTEHGIATVPGLTGVPGFSLESELESAREFRLEPAAVSTGKDSPSPRTVGREEMSALATAPSARGAAASHANDEE